MKTCSKCKIPKELSSFTLNQSWCKLCNAERSRNKRKADPAKAAERCRKWRSQNKEKAKIYQLQYNNDHKKEIATADRRWREKNKARTAQNRMDKIDHYRAKGRKHQARRIKTPSGHLNHSMSRSVWQSIRRNKLNRHWEALVGYSLEELKNHLERQFRPGMTWDNYGPYWHIDHKIPIAAFNFQKPEDIDFKRCWALANLQPLEATENQKKKAKTDKPFQPSLTL